MMWTFLLRDFLAWQIPGWVGILLAFAVIYYRVGYAVTLDKLSTLLESFPKFKAAVASQLEKGEEAVIGIALLEAKKGQIMAVGSKFGITSPILEMFRVEGGGAWSTGRSRGSRATDSETTGRSGFAVDPDGRG